MTNQEIGTLALIMNCLKKGCDIEIMKTIIHEFIHADLIELYRRIGPEFEGEPLIKQYWNEGGDWEHEYMANKLINEIIKGLKNMYGNKYNEEEYLALAWSRLHKTKAFKNSGFTKKHLTNILDNIEKKCNKSCIN